MDKILVIDRSRTVRNTLCERLSSEGFSVECVNTVDLASDAITNSSFELVLTEDVALVPQGSGLPFIVMATQPSIEQAVVAMRSGAVDYLAKPIDMVSLIKSVKKASKHSSATDVPQSQRAKSATVKRNSASNRIEPIIGTSPQMEHVRALIDKVALSDARVLIEGANGTGKELVARWLHQKSHRATAPFVEVNCAAIPSELIESELFGHERGAFTSAVKQRKGKFEQANGGILFMDEIGDMSLSAQAKVLRALQEKRICRVGGDRDLDVDVRVFAATNKDLLKEIERGNFREDLYHRLSVIVIPVPSLADHISDLPLLVEHFVSQISEEYALSPKAITSEAMQALMKMPWSGNIRQLRNVIERLMILSGKEITIQDINSYVF